MKKLGLFKLKGSTDGYSFYTVNGETRIRKTTGFTADQIKNDPKLARVRENNQEFAGAANIGKRFRLSIAQALDEMSDSSVSNRISTVFRSIIGRATSGVLGERDFDPFIAPDVLANFPFDVNNPLEQAFLAPYSVTTNAGRTQVVVTVPDFNASDLVRNPSGATHFRIVVASTVLSSYTFDASTNKYVATDLASNGKNALAFSDYIPVKGMVGAATTVTAAITPAPTLLASSGLVACVGIDFAKLASGSYYLLNGSTTMKIYEVF